MVSAVVNRKVYIKQGDIKIHANLYMCLVGEQGGRKSTPKDFARDIITSTFPDIAIGASMQSREEIVQYLASDESIRAYKTKEGALVEYHPYVFFINELKNFLSFNPGGMIEFLTDIYDREYFDARTLKRGAEIIPCPSITILACETPEWIIDKLKARIISGGFSRRMLYIYEIESSNPDEMVIIARPVITKQANEAKQRVISHLRTIKDLVGVFSWTAEAERFFDAWYRKNKLSLPKDPILRGYFRTKDAQLLKVCMNLAVSKPNPELVLTDALLIEGLALLESVEKNLPKLSIAAGRNVLAVPQQRLLEMVNESGGIMDESEIMRRMDKELAPMEMLSVLRFLKDSQQLLTYSVNGKVLLATRSFMLAKKREQQAAAQKEGSS